MKRQIVAFIIFSAVINLTIFIYVGNAMSSFKNDFEKRWEELSNDIDKLNEYTKLHPVELRNVKVDEKILDGAIFTAAIFDGIEWENTSIEDAIFSKTVFKNCKFINTKNWNSTFTDVLFENCIFYGAEFGGSKMVNVLFKGCKISDSRLKELTGTELVIEGSTLDERTSLAWSSIPMVFRQCTLEGVGLSGMKQPNSMTVEDCLMDEVDFGRGLFSAITLRRVKQGTGPVRFNGATAESIKIENVDMWSGLSFAGVKAGSISIEGGRLNTAFSESIIPKIYLRNVHPCALSIRKAKLQSISLVDCDLANFQLWDGFVEEMLVQNSTIGKSYSKNFKADTVVWDNFTLDGKIDFSDAYIKDFVPSRIKRGANLNLITTGSNIKL